MISIANAPQNVTRQAPLNSGAPPALAATAPKDARNTSDMIEIQPITYSSGAISVTPTRKTALRIKLVAEAIAAEMGLALSVSEIPS